MSRERGFAFEDAFVRQAHARGHRAYRVRGHRPHDVVVDGVRVQCKSKEFDENGRVRIAKGQKKYKSGDWDVLALEFRGTLYLIPERLLRTCNGTVLTVIRPTRFRRWVDAWHVFSVQMRRECEREQGLFDKMEATDGR